MKKDEINELEVMIKMIVDFSDDVDSINPLHPIQLPY